MYFAEVLKNSEGLFVTTTDLSVTSGTETVALPSDFFECRALYIQRNNGYDILPYQPNLTDGYATNTGTGSTLYSPYYFFRANNLVLRPVPDFTASSILRLEYTQFPDTMVNGGDAMTSQVSPVFKQLIEMYAIYKAKLKESLANGIDLTAVPKANRDEIFRLFIDTINKRSEYPEFIQAWSPEGAS